MTRLTSSWVYICSKRTKKVSACRGRHHSHTLTITSRNDEVTGVGRAIVVSPSISFFLFIRSCFRGSVLHGHSKIPRYWKKLSQLVPPPLKYPPFSGLALHFGSKAPPVSSQNVSTSKDGGTLSPASFVSVLRVGRHLEFPQTWRQPITPRIKLALVSPV